MQTVLGKQSGIAIFPYDGMSRVRFAGQGVCSPTLSRKHPTPRRRICYAVVTGVRSPKNSIPQVSQLVNKKSPATAYPWRDCAFYISNGSMLKTG